MQQEQTDVIIPAHLVTGWFEEEPPHLAGLYQAKVRVPFGGEIELMLDYRELQWYIPGTDVVYKTEGHTRIVQWRGATENLKIVNGEVVGTLGIEPGIIRRRIVDTHPEPTITRRAITVQ